MNRMKLAVFSLFVITGCTRNYYVHPSKTPETCVKPATVTSAPKVLIKAIAIKEIAIANFNNALDSFSCANWLKAKNKNDQYIYDYNYLSITEFNKSYFTEQELKYWNDIAFVLTGLTFKIDSYYERSCR